METGILTGLAGILVLGVCAQWIAWRIHLPSILLLLFAGILAGPVTGILQPDELFGDLLFPIVSLSVAIILFEGGLGLNIHAWKQDGQTIWKIILVGALATWVLSAAFAHFILKFEPGLAILTGAILIVTGPTVIIPLLLYIRPMGRIGSIAKWEGIVNDPIGAIAAVLVFEILITTGLDAPAGAVLVGLLRAILAGVAIGALGAGVIYILLKRHWLPDLLQEPVVLMLVIASYVAADAIQKESGLLAVTLMGIVLSNQHQVSIRHIIEFKERLRVLLISGLFVLLAARLKPDELMSIGLESVLFLAALVLVVRPASILLSTIGSGLKSSERIFLSWLAPRGIVAAAVGSLFALKLSQHNYPGAERLVPEIFFVIIGTVCIYGLSAAPLARRLRLATRSPQGLLIVGAHRWARELALAVKNQEFEVVLVDTNWRNVAEAKMMGLTSIHGNFMAPQVMDTVAMHSIGKMVALTPNDEANSLAVMHFDEVLDKSDLYQLAPRKQKTSADGMRPPASHLQGRLLFAQTATYEWINQRISDGAIIKAVRLSEKFTLESFHQHYGQGTQILFLVTSDHHLIPKTYKELPSPGSGQTVIALVNNPDAENQQSIP